MAKHTKRICKPQRTMLNPPKMMLKKAITMSKPLKTLSIQLNILLKLLKTVSKSSEIISKPLILNQWNYIDIKQNRYFWEALFFLIFRIVSKIRANTCFRHFTNIPIVHCTGMSSSFTHYQCTCFWYQYQYVSGNVLQYCQANKQVMLEHVYYSNY